MPSAIEAIGLDVGMAVFSLLALGLAMAGQSARIERALIVVCAVASAGQNYAAADVTSPRSVAAYVVPPLFLALVVDRVVAVVRRHVLGDAERSVWAAVGRGAGRRWSRPSAWSCCTCCGSPGAAVDLGGPAPDGAQRGAAARRPPARRPQMPLTRRSSTPADRIRRR